MNEAVEIAKLRLFLKLMACVEPDYGKENLGLEPLPDIDFNIRSGNSLVGFATRENLEDALEYTIDGLIEKPALLEKMQVVSDAFKRFKEIQLSYACDTNSLNKAKHDLAKRLIELNDRLNIYLSKIYGILEGDATGYESWLESHKPFHWFAEFYEILERGGFDVIIGNPPYVEWNDNSSYRISDNYQTKHCNNLYAYVVEQNSLINSKPGRTGMIIPHSSICTDRMNSVINLFNDNSAAWFSTYCIRPSKLFDGADQRLLIYLSNYSNNKTDKSLFSTTSYKHWYHNYREFLFDNLNYITINELRNVYKNTIPKYTAPIG